MEYAYNKVGLGFAEFVSQLIHETFDAILDSQNYQLEKYLELERALSISIQEFRTLYLTDEEIESYINQKLGFDLVRKMRISTKQAIVLNNILKDLDPSQNAKDVLSNTEFDLIYDYYLYLIVEEKRVKIRMIVERPELARLIVDGGEIKSKLDLSVFNQEVKEDQSDANINISKKAIETNLPNSKENESLEKLNSAFISLKDNNRYGITKIQEAINGNQYIFIDKQTINSTQSIEIPTTRIIATPVSSTNATSISSEVIIKFRSL